MIKILLTASTNFIAILLIANSAIAITSLDTLAQARQSTLNLNIISPSLQLISNSTPSNHFGCSCASCIQSVQTTTI